MRGSGPHGRRSPEIDVHQRVAPIRRPQRRYPLARRAEWRDPRMHSNCWRLPAVRTDTAHPRWLLNTATWRLSACSSMRGKTQVDTTRRGTTGTRRRCIKPCGPDMTSSCGCWWNEERDWTSRTRSMKARPWAGPRTGGARRLRSPSAPEEERPNRRDSVCVSRRRSRRRVESVPCGPSLAASRPPSPVVHTCLRGLA